MTAGIPGLVPIILIVLILGGLGVYLHNREQ